MKQRILITLGAVVLVLAGLVLIMWGHGKSPMFDVRVRAQEIVNAIVVTCGVEAIEITCGGSGFPAETCPAKEAPPNE